MRFQGGCEKNVSSNQLAIVIVEKIPEEKEPEVFKNTEIHEEQIKMERGTITVSIPCYSLIGVEVLTVKRIRRTWRIILVRRRCKV